MEPKLRHLQAALGGRTARKRNFPMWTSTTKRARKVACGKEMSATPGRRINGAAPASGVRRLSASIRGRQLHLQGSQTRRRYWSRGCFIAVIAPG